MSNIIHWSPPTETFSRACSLVQEIGNGTNVFFVRTRRRRIQTRFREFRVEIYCQAVVQVLFADSDKDWAVGEIGELVLYKSAPKRQVDSADLFLSFFASERYRFLIKLSEIAKFWRRSDKNFVAIYHGRLVGLNFAIEHSLQVELLVKHMQGFFSSPSLISERFMKVFKHFRLPNSNKYHPKNEAVSNYTLNPNALGSGSTNYKKKQTKIEDDLDPILEPYDFLKQVIDCPASEDI